MFPNGSKITPLRVLILIAYQIAFLVGLIIAIRWLEGLENKPEWYLAAFGLIALTIWFGLVHGLYHLFFMRDFDDRMSM